jgi:hypothetical protein
VIDFAINKMKLLVDAADILLDLGVQYIDLGAQCIDELFGGVSLLECCGAAMKERGMLAWRGPREEGELEKDVEGRSVVSPGNCSTL